MFTDYLIYILIGILIALPFLYELSHTFRFYLKYSIYYTFVMLTSLFCIPFIAWRPGNVRNALIATLPIRILNSLFGMNWEIEGIEHIIPDRAAIVVVNHQSLVDFLGMVYMWPVFCKMAAIGKKEILYVMPFGLTAWLCGTRFVDRSNPQKAKTSMNAALDYCKENKVKLWIFAEGTRSMKDELLPFKKGAFHLAVAGQLPILPLVYSSYRGFLDHSLKVWNPGNVVVTCLDPIPTEGLGLCDVPALMEEVRSKMNEEYRRVSEKVKQPFPLISEENKT